MDDKKREWNDWQAEGVRKAEQAAVDVTNLLNTGFGMFGSSFIESMARQHRTLQQMFTGVCLLWFKHLASLNENQYDLRNEHSVRVAKMIKDRLESEYGQAWSHMPHI